MEVKVQCDFCQEHLSIPWNPSAQHCEKPLFDWVTSDFPKEANQCPHCGAAHLYRRVDFNRKLGLGLVALGILGAYFTYGLSLLVVTLIDFWLYRRLKEVGICYQCNTEFRGDDVKGFETFDLEISDYYQNRVRDSVG